MPRGGSIAPPEQQADRLVAVITHFVADSWTLVTTVERNTIIRSWPVKPATSGRVPDGAQPAGSDSCGGTALHRRT
jgi:hypothetical protein